MLQRTPKIALLICVIVLSINAQTKLKFVCGSEVPRSGRDFGEWMHEVKLIISDVEQEKYLGLPSDEERINFIQKFWQRRDPDPDTVENEFQQTFCKRIEDSDRFRSGVPGWKTDRGKVYVLFGRPSNIQNGRARLEGLKNIPFEKWTFDHIEGYGENFQITFIDPSESNEFRFVSTDRERMMKIFDAGKRGLTVFIGPAK